MVVKSGHFDGQLPTDHNAQALIPLSNSMLNIGFALAKHNQPLHGYAIMKEVQGWWWRRSNLTLGSLYRTLPRMIENGMIVEVSSASVSGRNLRENSKRFYELTEFGHRVLAAQWEREKFLLEVARSWLSPLSDEHERTVEF